MPTADQKIQTQGKKRQREKKGRAIGIQLLNGDKIFGTIEKSQPNKLYVKEKKSGVVKDIHRAIIARFMFIIDGGTDGDRTGE